MLLGKARERERGFISGGSARAEAEVARVAMRGGYTRGRLSGNHTTSN